MGTIKGQLEWQSIPLAEDWKARGFAPDEARAWLNLSRQGRMPPYPLMRERACDAVQYGDCPEIAAEYKAQGFTVQKVGDWLQFFGRHDPRYSEAYERDKFRAAPLGFPFEFGAAPSLLTILQDCRQVGLGIEEADKWIAVNFTLRESIAAKGKGVTLTEAAEWADAGIPPPEIFVWKDLGSTAKDAKVWKSLGFGIREVKSWKDAGLTMDDASQWGTWISPAEVAAWKQQGWSVAEGKTWTSRCGLGTASKWKKLGFTPSDYDIWSDLHVYVDDAPRIANLWRSAGYAPTEARKWIGIGLEKPSIADDIKRSCPKGTEPIEALYKANPYDVKNRCFEFVGETIQILSRTSGLFSLGGQPVLVKFGERSAPPHVFRGLVKGVGTFSYEAVSRSAKIVPSLEAVFVQEGM